jgi:poly(3-hydroxybutyrate) depolymerase
MKVWLLALMLLLTGLAGPANADTGRPLVVFLHGCGADPEAYGLDVYAEARGFAVVYPTTEGCWHGTADEAARILAATREVQARESIDPSRIYIAGHSAGSGMAALTAETYPNVYAAVGMVSGANTTLKVPPRPLPAYFVWGSADATTSYLTGRLQLLQWLLGNGSATSLLPSTELSPGSGPTPTFVIEHYRGPADVDFATGIGMGHIPDFSWPAVFPGMVTFLLAHRLAG